GARSEEARGDAVRDPAIDARPRHARPDLRAGHAARRRAARRGAGGRAESAALLHRAVRGHPPEEAVRGGARYRAKTFAANDSSIPVSGKSANPSIRSVAPAAS